MDNPYEWLQSAIDQVPAFLQPLIVALAGMVPYIEGEGAAGLGILAGINPIVAAIAGAAGNILCVVAVVLLGSRVREGVVSRRTASKARTAETPSTHAEGRAVVAVPVGESGVGTGHATPANSSIASMRTDEPEIDGKPTRRAKGREKLRRWLVRFGVPGASILAPLALPTMLTAAFFVGSGVPRRWVILWQVVAIVLWTSLIAVAATGALALLGW